MSGLFSARFVVTGSNRLLDFSSNPPLEYWDGAWSKLRREVLEWELMSHDDDSAYWFDSEEEALSKWKEVSPFAKSP